MTTSHYVSDTKVEIAFDSGFRTPEGDRTWTDVSDYAEMTALDGIQITRGRSDEISGIEPSTCTVTLDNSDGRFTPRNAAGAYYPNVKRGRPLRVTVTHDGVDYVRFTGYVAQWPVQWPTAVDTEPT